MIILNFVGTRATQICDENKKMYQYPKFLHQNTIKRGEVGEKTTKSFYLIYADFSVDLD